MVHEAFEYLGGLPFFARLDKEGVLLLASNLKVLSLVP